MLRKDFRCTPVWNMVNWGVPDRVTITVTEYRTQFVFDRYHIVSPGDLQEVARWLAGTTAGPPPLSVVDSTPLTMGFS